jgi:serine/threonine-protein kinase HipA
MDVMGEAFRITRKHLLKLAVEEADLSTKSAADIIGRIFHVASGFAESARRQFSNGITRDTLRTIQARIDDNIAHLT